jgi:hypothetical protein
MIESDLQKPRDKNQLDQESFDALMYFDSDDECEEIRRNYSKISHGP